MMGNGLTTMVAAAIVAVALLFNGSFSDTARGGPSEEEMAEMYARAVGDIRNDIVINCGCCGEGEAQGPQRGSF